MGLKLNSSLGLEVGYEQAKALKKKTTVLGSDLTFGTIFMPGMPAGTAQFNTKTNIRAYHANLVGFLPFNEEYRLEVVGSLGMVRTQLKTILNIPILNNQQLSNDTALRLRQVFSKKKWVPKIGIGLQHMLNCRLGVRAMASWEGTAHTKDIKPNQTVSQFSTRTTARLKNSTILGLGLFYNFK